MNIAYFGSPEISALLLEKLLHKQEDFFNISLVITQPDKPIGKRLEIQPTAVKKKAQAYRIPVFDTELIRGQKDLIKLLERYNIDFCIIFAYGEIINEELLNAPKYGFWNIHPSLLPLYRGPSPVAYALMCGNTTTGVSLIQVDKKMDAGSIIEQEKIKIELDDRRDDLEQRLTLLGADLLIRNIKKLITTNKIDSKPQKDTLATYSHLLKKKDGFLSVEFIQKALKREHILLDDCPPLFKEYTYKYTFYRKDNKMNASTIFYNYYRALYPWPGIWTLARLNGVEKRIQIKNVTYNNEIILIQKIQVEGKGEVYFKIFNDTYKIFE